jgi:hypothetical protein
MGVQAVPDGSGQESGGCVGRTNGLDPQSGLGLLSLRVGLLKYCNEAEGRTRLRLREESVGTGNIAVDSFFPALLDFSRKIKTIAVVCLAKTRSDL